MVIHTHIKAVRPVFLAKVLYFLYAVGFVIFRIRTALAVDDIKVTEFSCVKGVKTELFYTILKAVIWKQVYFRGRGRDFRIDLTADSCTFLLQHYINHSR